MPARETSRRRLVACGDFLHDCAIEISSHTADAAGFPRGWALWAPLGAGALLRFAGLSRQVLGGDETHPLRAALSTPLGEILTTYQAPDFYPPFAGLCRLVVALGGTLDERWLRLPGLAAGLLLIWLLPRLAAPMLGRSTAQLAGWVLALAPPLVFYSRIVRSYAPLVLLVGAAAMFFYRWLAAPSARRAAGYVALAIVAVVAHPVAGPAAVAPLAFGGGLALIDRAIWRHRWRGLVAVGAALLAGLALALLPAHASLARLVATRRAPAQYGWETARSFLVFDAGVTAGAVALAVWALAAWGWWRLFRRQPRFAAFSLWMFLAPIAGVIALSPVGAGEPLVFNRYALVGLPFALLWLAAGLAELGALLQPRSARGAATVGAALLVAWVGLGPFAERSRWTSSFAHHNDFVAYPCPRPTLDAADVPLPYRQLAGTSGREAVVEYPWSPVWRMGRALYVYQGLHRREVFVGSADAALTAPNVHLGRVIAGDPAAFRASGARFVIVHLDPRQEEMRLRDATCGEPPAERWRAPVWTALAERGRTMAATLESLWGEPTWSDATVRVWDLQKIRR